MDQLRPKQNDPLFFLGFSLLLLLLFLHKISNTSYHDIGEYQFSEKNKGGLVSVAQDKKILLMEQLRPKTGNTL